MIDSTKVAESVKKVVDLVNDLSVGVMSEPDTPTVKHGNSSIDFALMGASSMVLVKSSGGKMYIFVKNGSQVWVEYEHVASEYRLKVTGGYATNWQMEQFKRDHTITALGG